MEITSGNGPKYSNQTPNEHDKIPNLTGIPDKPHETKMLDTLYRNLD